MHHTQRAAGFGFVVSTVVTASVAAMLLLPVADASAQGRRPRVSADLAERLSRGDTAESSVIICGTQARVDAIAAKHGLRVRERLQCGAVLDVPAGRLADVAGDPGVDSLSSNYGMQAHMGVTNVAIGAD